MTGETQIGFLRHLRSTHFALVIASGTLLLAFVNTETTFARALDQLRDLVRLTDELGPDRIAASVARQVDGRGGDLERFMRVSIEEFLDAIERLPPEQITVRTSSLYTELWPDDYFDDREGSLWFERSLAVLADGERFYLSTNDLPVGGLGSLGERRDRLDRLLAIGTLCFDPSFDPGFLFPGSTMDGLTRPASDVVEARLGFDTEDWSLTLSPRGIELTDEESRAEFAHTQLVLEEDPIGYESYPGGFDTIRVRGSALIPADEGRPEQFGFELALPVMFRTAEPAFVGEAMRELGISAEAVARHSVGARTTGELFPELLEVADTLPSASIQDLERYLTEQVRKGNTPITILGVSISTDLISVWGVIAMLAIHLYFCVHYQSFVGRLRGIAERAEFPWVGCYRSWIASGLFLISTALPAGVCVTMLVLEPTTSALRVVFLALAAALLGWSVTLHAHHMRRLAAAVR